MPYICPICSKPWRTNQKSIECSTCLKWVHHNNRIHCSGLTDQEFSSHANDSDLIFNCDKCVAKEVYGQFRYLPHHYEPHLDIDPFKVSKNQNIFNSAKANHRNFITRCSELGYSLSDELSDEDSPQPSPINSKYLDIGEFKNAKFNSPSNFSLCHLNIASLDLHADDLRLTLSRAKHNFNIIGISEHKIQKIINQHKYSWVP